MDGADGNSGHGGGEGSHVLIYRTSGIDLNGCI